MKKINAAVVGLGVGYANGEYGRQSVKYSLQKRNIIAFISN